jgi:hypothetical protein
MIAADTPQTSAVQVAPARLVTIDLAATVTGLTASAMRTKIARGFWLEGRQFRRAPDGRVWIDLQGVQQWVEQGQA